MSDEWQVGDLAECISSDWFNYQFNASAIGPKKGEIFCVGDIGIIYPNNVVGLSFVGRSWEADDGRPALFAATAFKKIQQKHEPCSESFKTLIRNSVKQPELV